MKSTINLPFAPNRSPFFYGWLILGLGTLGMLMSIPGQTIGVSVFTEPLIRVLMLSRTRLSLAYLVGTVSSALFLTAAGKLYDAWGARLIGSVVAFGLGITLLLLSRIDRIVQSLAAAVGGRPIIAFTAMCLGFFALRFLGQGVLALTARNMVMKWFDRHRGLANGIMGTGIALGFSYAPRLLNTMVEGYGWREAWILLGLIIGGGFTVLFLLTARDNPQQCGLVPDGGSSRKRAQAGTMPPHPEVDFTLPEARRSFTFWIYLLSLALFTLFVTAFTFHVLSIFGESGMDRERAVSIFLPASIISVVLNFVASWASDHIKMKYLLLVELLGLLLSMIALIVLRQGWPVLLLIVGQGINGGLFGVLSTITWPRLFGTSHLGAISGFAMGWMVAGSAVGPYLFSLSLQYFGSYSAAALLCLGITLALFVLAWKADKTAN